MWTCQILKLNHSTFEKRTGISFFQSQGWARKIFHKNFWEREILLCCGARLKYWVKIFRNYSVHCTLVFLSSNLQNFTQLIELYQKIVSCNYMYTVFLCTNCIWYCIVLYCIVCKLKQFSMQYNPDTPKHTTARFQEKRFHSSMASMTSMVGRLHCDKLVGWVDGSALSTTLLPFLKLQCMHKLIRRVQ